MRVTDSPETNDSLLVRIRDPQDRDAWLEFMSIYRPLIYRIGRRRGLQHADAQNLVQEVLQKVGHQIPHWQTGQPTGSFRRWLATVARNSSIDAMRRVRPDAARGGSSVQQHLHEVAHNNDSNQEFQRELEREAFRWAARRIRDEFTDSTWTAFWSTMVDGKASADVAKQLGKTVGAIYTARSRVMQRLKDELQKFDWETD